MFSLNTDGGGCGHDGGLAGAAGLFAWQLRLTRSRQPAACLEAFKHNHWVGMLLFVALLAGWLQKATLPPT